MKIRTHRLTLDDGRALLYLPLPHAGTRIAPRFLVVHYTAAACGWHAHTPEHIEATLAGLGQVNHYRRADMPGYDDIAPGRRRDPGPDFPPGSVRARLPGAPLPLGTEVEVLARRGLRWQVDGRGEVNGVTDIAGWSPSKYLEAMIGD